VHTAGWRAIRCHRAGLLIVVLALAAPAMNLAMGAVTSIAARPAAVAPGAGSAAASAEIDCASADRPSGSAIRLIQKARGVLAPNMILADTSVAPPGTTAGRPPLVRRSVAVPAAPQTAGQPHRGPPPAGVPRPEHRRPHGLL
jgi:hypothetical protein